MDCTGVQISEVSLLAKHCFTLLSCPACFLKKETVAHQKIRPAPVLNFRLGQKKNNGPSQRADFGSGWIFLLAGRIEFVEEKSYTTTECFTKL